ncbi:MAG TPA: DUF1259 domain-containing protein [Opitutaceae bacterium]|nr:DUF1259 domain-containing protein [Opitutaceae bacterium]
MLPRTLASLTLVASLVLASSLRAALDGAHIEQLTGLKGAPAGDTFKVTSPRTDVPVVVDGRAMPPFMGLTSWAAFEAGGKAEAMVMGDFVLFQDEVAPAMKAALGHGLAVTALHNHFFYDEPRVFFMHIGGEGSVDTLAGGVHALLDAVKTVRAAAPRPATSFGQPPLPADNKISAAPLEPILGVKLAANSGMAKAVIGRTTTMDCGCPAGADMGVNTWAVFAGHDDDAVVDGDFAVAEAELQPVLKSLTGAGIAVVSIHSHMTGETPRILFLHYWGRGPASTLASTLKAALALEKL